MRNGRDDVGLVALGIAVGAGADPVEPGRADGLRAVTVAQFPSKHREVLLGGGYRDAGRSLDGRQHLALVGGFEPSAGKLPQHPAELVHVGREGQLQGGGAQIVEPGERRRLLSGRQPIIMCGDRALAEIIVEIIAVQGRDDGRWDVGLIEAVGQGGGGLLTGLTGIGEDGDAACALGPLPLTYAARRQRRPGGHAENGPGRQGSFDAFGDAQVAIGWHGGEAHAAAFNGSQHLFARWRLARAVVEQEGAVDAADEAARAIADNAHQSRPTAPSLEIGKVVVVQQIGRAGIADATGAQIGLAEAAGQRLDTPEDAGDLQVVGRLRCWRTYWGRQIEPCQPRRFLEQFAVGQAGGVVDQIDGAGAFAGGMVETPAGMGAGQVQDARALLARRPPRQVGAAQRPAVLRPPRLRKQSRQPVRCRRGEAVADVVQVEAGRRQPDVVEVDHARITSPRSARVMAV